jgi:hypothetical protein
MINCINLLSKLIAMPPKPRKPRPNEPIDYSGRELRIEILGLIPAIVFLIILLFF